MARPWIQPAEHHKWELGCRICQMEAEQTRDRYLAGLEAIFLAAERHPLELYDTIEAVKMATEK